jgi:sugar phosphate isomerase/epimerase
MKPISLQLYTLREMAKADWIGMLKTVADIGYLGVETAGLYGQKPADFKKVVDDLGLKVVACHGAFPDPDRVKEFAETTLALGAKYHLVAWIGPHVYTSADEIKRAGALMQASAEMMAAHGVKFGYHNHEHEMAVVDGEIALARLYQAAPAMIGEVDTYWTADFGRGDAPAFIRRFAKRLPLLHIKDGMFDRTARVHVSVGAGKMNIPAVIDAADPSVLESLVVELDNCATDMLTAVKESYAYMTSHKLAQGRK